MTNIGTMDKRIVKYTGKLPISFSDLIENFTSKIKTTSGDYLYYTKTPVYIVNKVSGMMHEILQAGINKWKMVESGSFCSVFASSLGVHFSVRKGEEYKDKIVDEEWGSFYRGNYALFLSQKDAAQFSHDILWKKKMKLDSEITMLEELIK